MGEAAEVGRGQFGVVFKARWSGRSVAVKSGVGDDEYELQSSIPRHVNVVEALGIIKDIPITSTYPGGQGNQLVMELCKAGTVANFVQSAAVRLERCRWVAGCDLSARTRSCRRCVCTGD